MENPSPVKYYLVLDFEANCSSSGTNDHEVIEFPVNLVDAKTGDVLDTFREFVRPTKNPVVSEFIHGLTGIEQRDVDEAEPFVEVLASFDRWLARRPDVVRDEDAMFVTCGGWDLRTMMPRQCMLSGVEVPPLFRRWINLKVEFAKKVYCHRKGKKEKQLGMAGMIHALGLEIEGRHHSGIDDVKNITRVLQHMIKTGKMQDCVVSSLDD